MVQARPEAAGDTAVRWRSRALAGLLLLALGGPSAAATAPAPDGWVVSPGTLEAWHRRKGAAPTFAGSPAWRDHVDWVEAQFRKRQLADIRRDGLHYTRWWVRDDPRRGDFGLALGDESVPVAGYWAYSGATPPEGVTAPLLDWTPGLAPGAARDRILVFRVPPLPAPLPPAFAPPGHAYATADLDGLDRSAITGHWYQVNYATRFGGLGAKLKSSGAAGGIVVFDMGRERARGLYTFPLLEPGELGVPALYVDRSTGARLAAQVARGGSATLTLKARREPADAWFLSAVLPGSRYGTPEDEFVLLITHTDGPNLTQENGALGILAMLDGLARVPRAERPRSVLVVLDPQHYMPGRHQVDWFARHPAVAGRIVASVGVEQLGQREYVEEGDRFMRSGRPEVSVFFSQDNPVLIDAAIGAIQAAGLPRTELRVPARPGQGRWMGLGEVALERGWPGYALNTDMSAYWAVGPGMESFDADLAAAQVTVLTALTRTLLSAPLPRIAPAARPQP